MNLRSSLKVMLLALVVSSVAAENCCDSICDKLFDTNNWYLTPKIGVAPSIFAGRARQQFVVPRAAITEQFCDPSGTSAIDTCYTIDGLLGNFANTLQDTACLPKFNDMFNQGVLHVGVELGYQSCESNCPVFVEFIYNRANGRCNTPCSPYITNRASTGCLYTDCSTNSCTTQSSCSNSCTPTGTSLSNVFGLRDDYSNYSAYGAYIGGRHFTNRFWCDSTAWWFGYKVGILHRKQVNSCSTLVATSDCNNVSTATQDIALRRAIFCKSNAVSGGIQMGFDYNYSDCLAFQLGFEVVASAGLKGNRNHAIDLGALRTTGTNVLNLIDCSNLPSNIIVHNSGTLVSFPIWFGIRWDFGGFCNPCGAC